MNERTEVQRVSDCVPSQPDCEVHALSASGYSAPSQISGPVDSVFLKENLISPPVTGIGN